MRWTLATSKMILKNMRKIPIAGLYLHLYAKDFKNKDSFFYCSAINQSKDARRLQKQVKRGRIDPNSFDDSSLMFFVEIAKAKKIRYGKYQYTY